jgi:Protein of unknown function (DUF3631)
MERHKPGLDLIGQKLARLLKQQEMNSELTNQTNKARPLISLKAPQPPAEHSENIGAKLQAAIREIFEMREVSQISTRNVLLALIERKGEPWSALWARDIARGNLRGSAAKLAQLLKPFGIAPGTIREPDGTTKGYKLSLFDDAFPATCPKSCP